MEVGGGLSNSNLNSPIKNGQQKSYSSVTRLDIYDELVIPLQSPTIFLENELTFGTTDVWSSYPTYFIVCMASGQGRTAEVNVALNLWIDGTPKLIGRMVRSAEVCTENKPSWKVPSFGANTEAKFVLSGYLEAHNGSSSQSSYIYLGIGGVTFKSSSMISIS